jgi:hypothetical protein
MRYNDWDILLFPGDQTIPLKEFRTSCHVVDDAELTLPDLPIGLPTVTCYVPSLKAGEPFQVSIHTWTQPDVSEITKTYSAYPESARFEARVFIDGRLIG